MKSGSYPLPHSKALRADLWTSFDRAQRLGLRRVSAAFTSGY